MKCLYEALGVGRTATEDEIRKAYRRQALAWHPDKHQGADAAGRAEAEERFKEVCNAYEVLSDPQEKRWYDGHRDQILRSGERHQAGAETGGGGGGGEAPVRPADLDLSAFFDVQAACPGGYGPGPTGFYAVFAALFHRLAEAERAAFANLPADGPGRKGRAGLGHIPGFGAAGTEWSAVAEFYQHWGGFATVRDFGWADVWNTASAPYRKARRMMEEENSKSRRKARLEYIRQVQDLVALLRGRDPRVREHRKQEERRKEEAERAAEERKRQEREERRARTREYDAQLFANAKHDEELEGALEAVEEAVQEEVECVVCDKRFKSWKQLRNHERSKKHLEQVKRLRELMEREEAEARDGNGVAPAVGADELFGTPEPPGGPEGGGSPEPGRRGKGKKKKKKAAAARAKLQAEQEAQAAAALLAAAEEAEDGAEEGGAAEAAEAAGLAQHLERTGVAEAGPEAAAAHGAGGGVADDNDWGRGGKKKKGKKGKGGGKKSASTSAGARTAELACKICGLEFPSKTKLFKHINETGHAALKTG